MTQRKIITIDGGSPQYWQERKQGFRLIHEAFMVDPGASPVQDHRNPVDDHVPDGTPIARPEQL